jgi:transcription elongation factor Elf1
MSVYVDKKYISLLAPKLQQFKQRGEFLWNFRCPVCGDSQKNKIKTRGYIYKRKEHFGFMCHNCGSSMPLQKFIRYVDPHLYSEYQLETFVQSNTTTKVDVDVNEFVTKPEFKPRPVELGLPKVCFLNQNHPARKYMEDRKVPTDQLYYTEDFAWYIKYLYPENDKQLYKEERIIIPFFDKEGNLLGVQGRAIGPSKIKYITIKASEESPKIYGWDKVDTSKNVYVVEGPIDSLFLDNCVATMDAALYHAVSVLGVDTKYIFVYDNEPRNKQIVSNMRKTIDMGYRVCIWPDTIEQKDINEMVLAGMHPSQIQHIIDNNTYEGLIATMKMNQWARI